MFISLNRSGKQTHLAQRASRDLPVDASLNANRMLASSILGIDVYLWSKIFVVPGIRLALEHDTFFTVEIKE